MMGLKKSASTTVFFALVLVLCYLRPAQSASSLVLGGTIRDQSPAWMIHKNYPSDWWQYNSWTDNPTDGTCGTANGGLGFNNSDFELPLWMYGSIRTPNAKGGVLYNGEPGLVGNCCNKSNSWTGCAQLGSDGTPQYAYTGHSPFYTVQSPANYYTWFHDSPQTFNVLYNLTLPSLGGRLYGYNGQFFPIDGRGWQDSNLGGVNNNEQHNFAFCFEIHGHFSYQGGEIFQFTGDDDLWVFLDSKLVIDLGGVHTALSAEVYLDDMGLILSNNYRFDFFYCERHTTVSDLQLTTSIQIACTYYDWCDVCDGNGQTCCTATDIQTCNDNNACTTDSCAVLVPPAVGCQHVDISAGCPTNLCHPGGCNPAIGCYQNTTVCNDNNACTTDTCNNGTGCVFTPNAITCGDKCNTPYCDTTTGQCKTNPVVCNDNNVCTVDTCNPTLGCQYTATTCPSDACNTGTCNPSTGCVNTTIPCNDNNVCTSDTCNAVSGCKYTAIPCTSTNLCQSWSCTNAAGCHYTNVTCNDNNPCTIDSCNPASGCQYVTNTCNDNNACTTDTCSTSTGCKNTLITCNDNNLCTADTCNNQTGCAYTEIPCTGGNACTNTTCSPTLGCQYPPISCNDSNVCTQDTCDDTYGCQHTVLPCTTNTPCTNATCSPTGGCQVVDLPGNCDLCKYNNGSFITCAPYQNNLCFPQICNPNTGNCTLSTPVNCDDSNACTNDSCAAATGTCDHVSITCNDNNDCTTDTCASATGCVFTNVTCNDNNPCTTDSCNPAGGACVHTQLPDNCIACAGAPCQTADPCNPSSCNGTCVSAPYNCDDGNPCTADSCSSASGAAVCSHILNACNQSNACAPQQCNVTTGFCDSLPKDCDDGNACTTDSCSVVGGVATCENPIIPCTGSTPCQPLQCFNGSCQLFNAPNCDDFNECTTDTCVNTNGFHNCTYSAVNCSGFDTGDLCTPAVCNASIGCTAGTWICDDANVCTLDTCVGEMECNHTVGDFCDDSDACTNDICNSAQITLEAACSHTNITCTATNVCNNVTGCNATTGCVQSPVICPNSTDWCQLPTCDTTIGCTYYAKPCIVNDPDCYVGTCDSVLQQCVQSELPDWTQITTQKGGGVTCYAFYNKAQTIGIITGGVVAGIVVGAVVFAAVAAVAARKAYLYMQLKQGNMGAAQSNPLYTPGAHGGENPLFGR